ncbi:hypothetical protein EG68_04038 [Paragonimus skrjabini miyazakii]|uniref:ATP synthase-coupling factor 6, mitochondrial n=1 Tax=Paragonimus skrjabini miyazakii TaxID=59628 RepID=A0A8S9YZ78_9TREM|nr:hypothetical protein EG68_04038 [Paragonimus skrjabini miyazakii]
MYLRALPRSGFSCLFSPRLATKATSVQANDPIQKAFLQKLHEYNQKSKSGEMGLADAKPNEIKELKDTLTKIDRIFGATGQDMTQFPAFKFDQPQLVHPHSTITAEYPEETEEVKENQKAKDDRFILTI